MRGFRSPLSIGFATRMERSLRALVLYQLDGERTGEMVCDNFSTAPLGSSRLREVAVGPSSSGTRGASFSSSSLALLRVVSSQLSTTLSTSLLLPLSHSNHTLRPSISSPPPCSLLPRALRSSQRIVHLQTHGLSVAAQAARSPCMDRYWSAESVA